jgi:hypothetical protein
MIDVQQVSRKMSGVPCRRFFADGPSAGVLNPLLGRVDATQ